MQAGDSSPVDHNSYLVEAGSADILFPTDFDLLCEMYQNLAGGFKFPFGLQKKLVFYAIKAHEEEGCRQVSFQVVEICSETAMKDREN